jgi:hypothetical protein
MESMHQEITGLEPNETIPFKIELIDAGGIKMYSSAFHFLKTPETNTFIVKYQVVQFPNDLQIYIESVRDKGIEEADYHYIVTHQNVSDGEKLKNDFLTF